MTPHSIPSAPNHDKRPRIIETELAEPFGRDVALDPGAVRQELLELGYTPIPLVARDKIPPRGFPLGEYERGERTVTPDVIRRWSAEYPDATNTGILCGPRFGVMAIDPDNTEVARYLETAPGLGLPRTPTTATARGKHYLFTCPPDFDKSYTGDPEDPDHNEQLIPGMCTKCSGYVVAPGSVHPSGVHYGSLVSLSEPLAAPPAWLVALYRKRRHAERRASTPRERTASAPARVTSTPDLSPTIRAIEAALGVTDASFLPSGFAPVRCPFPGHDDHKESAGWTRDGGGQLHCFRCTPGPNDHSWGKESFGYVDTARALGLPLPRQHSESQALVQNTPAPTNVGLGRATPDGERANSLSSSKSGESGLFPSSAPPKTLLITAFTRQSELGKNTRGRKTVTFTLGDVVQQVRDQGVEPVYRALTGDALASAAQYRATVHEPLEAGVYARGKLADSVGVSESSSRRYDKLTNMTVIPRIRQRKLGAGGGEAFTDRRADKRMNEWLESTSGKRYPPTRDGFSDAYGDSVTFDGRALVYHKRQSMNYYEPQERDGEPIGLPVQVRRALVQAGETALARVIDALLLAGVEPGDSVSIPQIIKLVAPYGVGKYTTRNALRREAERLAAGGDTMPTFSAHSEPAETPVSEAAASECERVHSRGDKPAAMRASEPSAAETVHLVHQCVICGTPAVTRDLGAWYCEEHAHGDLREAVHAQKAQHARGGALC